MGEETQPRGPYDRASRFICVNFLAATSSRHDRSMQLTFEQRRARRSLSTQLLHVETSNVVSMPDRVLTLAAHPFLAPSRCMVARGSQDVRPSHASQNRSLQGNICVRENNTVSTRRVPGGKPPPTPAWPHISCAKHKLRERTPVGAASRLLDGSTYWGRWHAAVMRTRESSGGWSERLARAKSWS